LSIVPVSVEPLATAVEGKYRILSRIFMNTFLVLVVCPSWARITRIGAGREEFSGLEMAEAGVPPKLFTAQIEMVPAIPQISLILCGDLRCMGNAGTEGKRPSLP
jgi:hypothetical protein